MLMKEKSDALPDELAEYERFIEELLQDTKHPIHNRAHPLHAESVKALNALMEQLEVKRNQWLSKG